MSAVADLPDFRMKRRGETRGAILAAAWDLAARDGIANLSLRALARSVGMRAPSLYTYFDSKAAIFDAMFAQGYRELDALYADLELDAAEPVETLAAATVQFVEFCQASIPRYQLLFTRVVADWQPSPEAYAASVASYDMMAQRLETVGIQGDRALDLWTALSAGLAAQQLANEPGGQRWVRLVREATEMFLNHLRRIQ